MMKTLIIYDDEGSIFSLTSGDYLIPQGGVQFAEVEIPSGKQVKEVDITVQPHQVVLEDIPPTEIDELKNKLQSTQEAVDFLLMGGM
jgi:hypothetical protein